MITIDINLPEGTKIGTTEKTVIAIEKFIKSELQVNEQKTEGI